MQRLIRLQIRPVDQDYRLVDACQGYPTQRPVDRVCLLLQTPIAQQPVCTLDLVTEQRLAREAAGRLVEAYHQSGDNDRARKAAEQYLRRYPNGPHTALARSVLQ